MFALRTDSWLLTNRHSGPSSGKSTLVQLVAALCGRSLVVIPLSGGSDTSDLLGGYEQADARRRFASSLYDAERLIKDVSHALLSLVRGVHCGAEEMQC